MELASLSFLKSQSNLEKLEANKQARTNYQILTQHRTSINWN